MAGRFEVLGVVAAGGMGKVYRALDRVTREAVALKFLKSTEVVDNDRFVREARVLEQLHHPGVVRYVAQGVTEEGEPWLAMEWLEGEDLAARLANTGLTLDESLRLTARVAETL